MLRKVHLLQQIANKEKRILKIILETGEILWNLFLALLILLSGRSLF